MGIKSLGRAFLLTGAIALSGCSGSDWVCDRVVNEQTGEVYKLLQYRGTRDAGKYERDSIPAIVVVDERDDRSTVVRVLDKQIQHDIAGSNKYTQTSDTIIVGFLDQD